MNKPVLDKKNLHDWLIGAIIQSRGVSIEGMAEIDFARLKFKAIKSKKLADEIMRFLEQYHLLHPDIK